MGRLQRLNPGPGIVDFWTEFKRPNPYRWPILIASILPAALMIWWGVNSTVYGEPEIKPLTEDDPLQPVNPYGMSKLMTERILADVTERFQSGASSGRW